LRWCVPVRLFRVDGGGKFTEYKERVFKSEYNEQILESWLENNFDSIVEDGALMVIGRQVATTFGSYIDLLGVDRAGNIAILELKRDRTPRETLAQALEYASFAESLDYEQLEQILRNYTGNENESLSEYHKEFFRLEIGEGVSFNKDQRIIIVGYNITPEIHQAATFLRNKGLRVTCVEFSYFQTESGEQLMSSEIVVGKEPLKRGAISTGTLPRIDKIKFLGSLDQVGLPVFEALLKMAEEQNLPIHWGSKGFSLNVDIQGTHVNLCYVYPPSSVFRQSIYTAFAEIGKKVESAEELVKLFKDRFERTGFFVPAGNELKFVIQQVLTNEQINALTNLIVDLANQVKEKGLVE